MTWLLVALVSIWLIALICVGIICRKCWGNFTHERISHEAPWLLDARD